MKRLRVLISSHEFSPYQGSECAVGWNIVTRMAALHDVTVLCADGAPGHPNSYRNAVSDYLEKRGAIPGLCIVYVEHPPKTVRYARMNQRLMRLTKGVGWQLLFFMGLDEWHREALRTAKTLGLENFDVVHQLTPISFRKPGYLWTTHLPFFWGPIGGTYKVPPAFSRWAGMGSLIFETARSICNQLEVSSSRFKRVVQKAERVWTVTEDERRTVTSIARDKAFPMIDTAPPLGSVGRVRLYDGRTPLKLCWSGRHEAAKALPLFLHALAQLPERNKVVLAVLGEGPETQRWQNMAKKLNLSGIIWHGRLSYHDALQKMAQSDVFIHSSFREAASMVVLEALGWGLPVICHDACGMAVAVNASCGIKVPFVNPETSIQGFRDALELILQNPGLVKQLSEGALRRASELSWDAKVKEIAEAYLRCTKS